jgi:hypothetical protein
MRVSVFPSMASWVESHLIRTSFSTFSIFALIPDRPAFSRLGSSRQSVAERKKEKAAETITFQRLIFLDGVEGGRTTVGNQTRVEFSAPSPVEGHLGLWTKADSKSMFKDLAIVSGSVRKHFC